MGKRLLLSLASLFVALLLVEVALRVAGVGSAGRGSPWFAGGNHPRFLFQEDPASGYALRPGFRGEEIAASGEFHAPVAIDGLGMRSQPQPPPGPEAVLAVGDSMTFGEGVPPAATWTTQLAERLGVQVWNGGVPGYNSAQMAAHARRLAAALHPALVLMVFLPQWDLGRCTHPFVYRDGYIVSQSYVDRLTLVDGNLYASMTRLPVLGRLTAYAQGYSNLGRLLLPRLHDRIEPAKVARDDAEMEHEREDWAACRAAIVGLRDELAASGSRLVVVFIESTTQANRRDARFARAALEAQGVEVLRLDSLLPASLDREAIVYRTDRHWNTRGHAAVADALAPVVRRALAAAKGRGAR